MGLFLKKELTTLTSEAKELWNPLLGADKKYFGTSTMKLQCMFGSTDQNEKTIF